MKPCKCVLPTSLFWTLQEEEGGGYFEQLDCKKNLVVFYLGESSLEGIDAAIDIIESLNGRHIYLQGSHDK